MNDGIPKRVVMTPCMIPKPSGINMATKKAGHGFHDLEMSSPITMGVKANMEPTDRSNSPEIIKKATPTDIIESEDATTKIPAISSVLMNTPDMAWKMMPSTTMTTAEPKARAWISRMGRAIED